jgi:hypothetical protein
LRKFYGLALCAGIASFLAVIYVLLHLDWGTEPAAPAPAAPDAVQSRSSDPPPAASGKQGEASGRP